MTLTGMLERMRGFDLERALGLRAAFPPLALALDGGEAVLVRLGRRRRGRPVVELLASRPLPEGLVPASIFQEELAPTETLVDLLRSLFERAGVRPGRLSLVLPDNLAKISLLTLPERPAGRRQLEQILRFRMRRAVPFRVEDALLSWQLVPSATQEPVVLVALMRRALVQHYERALAALGARVGLVDLATPNLLNLSRAQLAGVGEQGDVALLNCTPTYFTLVLLREGRLIFFRCKSFGRAEAGAVDDLLAREIAGSFSYYQEKLGGQAVRAMLVRSAGRPVEELLAVLADVGLEHASALDLEQCVELPPAGRGDLVTGHTAAPALGAAAGRAA